MDCDVFTYNFLREAYPKIDVRVIKATVLEHGDDVESALSFLNSVVDEVDEGKDASPDEEVIETCKTSIRILEDNAFTELDSAAIVPELSSSNSQVSLASLEEIVEEAKNDKELVINLVKEVSDLRAKADQERIAALRAKNEAATSGEALSRKAHELRKQISLKKQDNLLRMGEIYGEKVVLATEGRGLKLRLEQVKLQKERALTTLHGIKGRLQGCYEEALEERMMAEGDGKAKEKIAQEILAAEEALMTTIEEESKKLDMEAEACAQLKEFLSHHGSIIDSLQGEMSVLCEDVESFKRQVDDGMWSSVSTASLPANVNPEGPYIFRKCNMPSSSSSQELGQSFEALYSRKQSESRMNSSLRSESTGSVVQTPHSSSQGCDKESQQKLKYEEDGSWHQRHVDSCSSLYDSGEVIISNIMGCGSHQTTNNSGPLLCDSRDSVTSNTVDYDWHQRHVKSESLLDDSREALSSNLMDTVARSDFEGIHSSVGGLGMLKDLLPTSGSHLNRSWASSNGNQFADPSSNYYYTEGEFDFPSSPIRGDDWVFTPKQMEESGSSTSSSLIKVEAGDYHSN